ncbi:hypothetical protein, variant 1 [Aphanomyces invadans]|uniref:PLOD1-3-like GT domain-containing protein n=1 Tax=Aphanomyces invadans TaxID=157072 RepID=A0A024TXI2_9STRA|nr:hypothetical protein, variant 1 [Aphanomyces invadans]ETV98052.1 hypothetical protein, variant 1 [Aphanomyces invadans]|eukprot:XP_008873613.1 hypothetical protein, variant 1 [Aphanomyces invadans]
MRETDAAVVPLTAADGLASTVPASSTSIPRYVKALAVCVCVGVGLMCLDSNVVLHEQILHPVKPKDSIQVSAAVAGTSYIVSDNSSITSSNATTIEFPTTPAPISTLPTSTSPPSPPPVESTQPPVEPRLRQSASGASTPFKPKNIRFVTLADNPHGGICLLASSIFQDDAVLEVLAWNYSSTFFDGSTCGEACHGNQDNNNRYGQQKKLHWLEHYVEKNSDLDDDDLVLFTDAWDVIVQSSTQKLTDLFLKHTQGERGLIFNGEPTCGDSFNNDGMYGYKLRAKAWNIRLEPNQTPRLVGGHYMCNAIAAKTASNTLVAGPNWSLGSGGILGDVQSLRAFLRRVTAIRIAQEEEFRQHQTFLFEGDQILFQIAYLTAPEINVKIDTAAEIFFVISYLIGPGVTSSTQTWNGAV